MRGSITRFAGVRLRSLRVAARASVAEIAAAADVSESSIRKWESGEAKPSPQHLSRLAEIFDVSPAEMVVTTSRPTMQELRERCALTQLQVSERIGVSRSTVAAVESGSQAPSADARAAIADLYGVEVEAIDHAWQQSASNLRARGEAVRLSRR